MNARIKLRPAGEAKPVILETPAPGPTSGIDFHALGRRWVAGESIRALGREAGMEWNVLQGKLRVAGYLRAPKLTLKPKPE